MGGAALLHTGQPLFGPGWHVAGFSWPWEWSALPKADGIPWRAQGGYVKAPLLFCAATAALFTGGPALAEWFERVRLSRAGRCLCGYDLTGITGPCPECGKERKA
jgi:hypothetical protein